MELAAVEQKSRVGSLLSSAVGGLTGGVFIVIVELSFAALIFSGELSPFVGNGIGLALFGSVVITAVVALLSSYPGMMASPQDSPAAILALVSAAIAGRVAAASPEAKYNTVLAAIIVTSLITGIFFLLLGHFRLGGLVRFVPYPVIGGFLAGTGWLLIQGGMGVMTGKSLAMNQLSGLLEPGMLLEWVPGAGFGVLLLLVMRRFSQFWVMPTMLVGGTIVFYLSLFAMRTSLAEAGQHGWLLGPFPEGTLWQPLALSALPQIDWNIIASQFDKIGTILIISIVSLLLNASGIELATRKDVDLNRELRAAGFANLLASLGGGMVGYHMLTDTVMMHKMGAGNSRLTGLIAAAGCGAVLLFGASVLSYFPKPILGGLLLFMGLSFVVEWVYDAWFNLPRVEYVLVLVILVIVGAFGFLQGVGAGIGIAGILFIINYSRINIVKHTLSGATFRSRVDRSASNRQLLRARGDQIGIFALQGFIFFGTAQTLLEQCRAIIQGPAGGELRYLVVDFRHVVGLDSSAVSSFVRLLQTTEAKGISLILTQPPPAIRNLLTRGGLAEREGDALKIFTDLDHGVEWCENQILASEGIYRTRVSDGLRSQIIRVFRRREDVRRFFSYVEKQELPEGHTLIRQGEPADALYFIESGLATAQLELAGGQVVRLRVLRSGTFVGEVGMYLNQIRTASVVTARPSTVYRLSKQVLNQIEENDPEVSAALHKFLAYQMAERLADNTSLIEAMLR